MHIHCAALKILRYLQSVFEKLGLIVRLLFRHGLQHLRLEENPILEMQHVEAAAILLGGPTLKKFNDKGGMYSLNNFWKGNLVSHRLQIENIVVKGTIIDYSLQWL